MERRTGYALLGDERIAYEVVGDGAVDIVANSGWFPPFDVEWDDPYARAFIGQLTRFARMVRFDRRGVGASDPLPGNALPPWESFSDEIECVMDAAGSEQAVLMVGGSAVAPAALFATSHQSRTRGLILFQPTVRLKADEDYPFGLSDEEHSIMLRQLSEQWGTGQFIASMIPSRSGDPQFLDFLSKLERAATSPTIIRKYVEADARSDGRSVLPSITAPTLVIQRTDNPMLSVEHGRYIAESIPSATLVEVPGSDIAPYYEHADMILDAIEDFVTAIEPASTADRRLATVMFTDIVDSTRAAEDLGDRHWRKLLDRHDEIARQVVEYHSGHWVQSTGDGMLATFPGPGRAILAADNLLREMSHLRLQVRTGIHTGEIEVRGHNVGGIGVHIAARVMEMAGPSEILVSRTVKDLVVGSNFDFEDRGTYEFKGIDDAWQLYAVAG